MKALGPFAGKALLRLGVSGNRLETTGLLPLVVEAGSQDRRPTINGTGSEPVAISAAEDEVGGIPGAAGT